MYSAGNIPEKAQPVTEKLPLYGLFWGRVRVTTIKILLRGPDDSIEKVRINHAKYTTIYHANNLMSLIQLY
jgi:hypothetical protein